MIREYRPKLSVDDTPNEVYARNGLALLGLHCTHLTTGEREYPETVVKDALVDILHAAHAMGLDAEELAEQTLDNFLNEIDPVNHVGDLKDAPVRRGKPPRIPGKAATIRLIKILETNLMRTVRRFRRQNKKKQDNGN